jgi:hypothetical protein
VSAPAAPQGSHRGRGSAIQAITALEAKLARRDAKIANQRDEIAGLHDKLTRGRRVRAHLRWLLAHRDRQIELLGNGRAAVETARACWEAVGASKLQPSQVAGMRTATIMQRASAEHQHGITNTWRVLRAAVIAEQAWLAAGKPLADRWDMLSERAGLLRDTVAPLIEALP